MDKSQGYFVPSMKEVSGKVLVLHAWWGLNDTIKHYCDRLASEGFTVYAPDLYHGKLTDEIETAEIFSNELSLDQARIDLDEAVKYLNEKDNPQAQGIAVVGFSLGAYLALDLSNHHAADIHKVVVYYGTGPDDYTISRAAYLGHFAEFDVFEPQSNIDELKFALQRGNKTFNFHQYPNTGHWFCEPDRTDAYQEDAATLAWERTLSFLKKT